MSVLRFGAPFSLIWLLSIAGNFVANERWGPLLFYLVLTAVIAYASVGVKLNYYTRTLITLLLLYVLGTSDLIFFGVAEDWRLHYAALLMFTTIFLGRRAGFIALLICLVSFVSIAGLISTGALVITMSIMDSPIPDAEAILMMSMIFVFVSSIVIMVLAAALEEFEKAWERERLAAHQLSTQTKELEESLTREKLLANLLEHALTQQEDLNRLKSRIITTISHEFRTPLTVINSSAGLLTHHAARLTDQKREDIYQRIRRSIFYLTDLLQDIVWVDTSNSSAIKVHAIHIAFNAMCESLAERLHRETDHPANLSFVYAADDHTSLYVDPELIKQILFNLLTNSLKYSPLHTPVTVQFACNERLNIAVVDQGIGIPAEDLEKIWELFYRGANVEMYSGLGLGLYNVQRLVERLDGSIEVSSPGVNQGCTFQIQIPRDLAENAHRKSTLQTNGLSERTVKQSLYTDIR
ncbi:MAG: HAMP domain-containing sensor histidine kinase [Caldilineaceae bacterium]